ncbi:MAG: septum formation initiator family protein [Thermodesulfobacteriota bacterium]|nr:septum formation initiator family protein [Thermodesulfobacteriota bacterium]
MIMNSRPLCLFLVAVLGLSFALFGDKGALRLHQVRQYRAGLQLEVQQLRDSNLRLRTEVDALQHDDRYIEQVARGRLSFVREGELVYQFNPRTR